MRIALAQINNTVGDLEGNAAKILDFARQGERSGAELVAFPELALTGYPPRDLVEKHSFLQRTQAALESIARESTDLDVALIIGYVGRSPENSAVRAQNAAAVIDRGQLVSRQSKMLLPNYDVFDEARYFEPATWQDVVTIRGTRVALAICEDAWNDKQFWERRRYSRDPIEELVNKGAELIISINASPWNIGKRRQRKLIFEATAQRFKLPIAYVHMVGGNDQLIFDGSSFAMTADGKLAAQAKSFEEDLILFDSVSGLGDDHASNLDDDEAAYEALVL